MGFCGQGYPAVLDSESYSESAAWLFKKTNIIFSLFTLGFLPFISCYHEPIIWGTRWSSGWKGETESNGETKWQQTQGSTLISQWWAPEAWGVTEVTAWLVLQPRRSSPWGWSWQPLWYLGTTTLACQMNERRPSAISCISVSSVLLVTTDLII